MGALAGVLGQFSSQLPSPMLDMARRRGGLQAIYTVRHKHVVCAGTYIVQAEPLIAIVVDGYVERDNSLADLAAAGARIQTGRSGVEVVGPADIFNVVSREPLQGGFAMAMFGESWVVLARDRFGSRPLYFQASVEGTSLAFASELKALIASTDEPVALDVERLADVAVCGRPMGDGTLVRSIRCVRPGHAVAAVLRDGLVSVQEMQVYPERACVIDNDQRVDVIDRIGDLLTKSVDGCIDRSRPTALALSGGLDSSVIGFMAAQHTKNPIRAITVGADSDDEDRVAGRTVAAAIGATHSELQVSFADYTRALAECVYARELPSAVGLTFYLMARRLHGTAQVLLTGIGAAEVFNETNHYIAWPELSQRVSERLARVERLGLKISADADAAVAKLLRATSYEDYVSTWDPSSREWYIRPAESCAAAYGFEVRSPYYAEDLTGFMRLLDSQQRLSDKGILKAVAMRRFGDAIRCAVQRPKRALPEVLLRHVGAFRALCERVLPAEYVLVHPFGAMFPDRMSLLLIDVFDHLFLQRRAAPLEEFDIIDFMQHRALEAA